MNDEILVPLDLSDAIAMIDRQKEQIAALQELSTNLASENKAAAKQIAALEAEVKERGVENLVQKMQIVSLITENREKDEQIAALTAENEQLREREKILILRLQSHGDIETDKEKRR